jgi:hypothetical protein
MKFTYSSGQRPLDGYTLKRGIGHGGFGEVYYGVSDGGKEVALKLVRGDQEVELRGMAQCLNLKHPHLLALYDLKSDNHGDHWVVMEYVAGEPLSVVLNRHPNGLPVELAKQWFLSLAKAVGYLHDHGIVHRDLKPGNIFLENGLLKVGDYGLSKFISGSQRTAQTQSVGTVHYMAPEVSTGNYNKQIDIYAAGIILYEMLTGRVPFEGESAGEILMKHLTTPPDLTKLPREYVGVVGKALAKNPAHRYATMSEMAKAVEAIGGEPRRAPEPARPVPVVRIPPRPAHPEPIPVLNALPAQSWRTTVAELCSSLALAALFAVLAAMLCAAIGPRNDRNDKEAVDYLLSIGTGFFLTVAACWAILIPAKMWTRHGKGGDGWTRRIIMLFLGGLLGAGALWLNGWTPAASLVNGVPEAGQPATLPAGTGLGVGLAEAAGYLSFFALAFFALRWWRLADRRRSHRFSLGPILAAGFWGLLLLVLIWPHGEAVVVLMAAAAIVQLVSPWEQPPPSAARRVRLRYA